ncbi:uncharacterized protein LOC117639873 [Thrips palmi]|uniref:Uncharacterized protein LOC117639873 n=1 Tax=Thrips palmi TaxID=161013 RepID=A0A6P8Y6S3_THRPL|nr:uncharacterized protein LOC117639873 [Thrips palmi]
MPTTYAVARPRNADAHPKKKDARCQEPEQVVSTYRGIAEDQHDERDAREQRDQRDARSEQDDDVVEYMEVDEAALERRRRDMVTPEVSSVCSEEPPTPPAPRASVSSTSGFSSSCPHSCPPSVQSRAPLELPPEADEDVDEEVDEDVDEAAAMPTPDSSRLGQPLPPPHERTSPAAFNDSIIPEEDEDEDAFSTALYSDVIEDEDLYITVPSEWDGENSFGSSRSGADETPAPFRPPRQPAQVIVIRENNIHSQSNGNAPRPPQDAPPDRPVPRLSVQCVLCCEPRGDKTRLLSQTAGCRWLATALVLFFLLVSLLLLNLANRYNDTAASSSKTKLVPQQSSDEVQPPS